MTDTQQCPIRSAEVDYNKRYSGYLCRSCAAKAAGENGRILSFSNVSFSGGLTAHYADTGEEHHGHICYIDGIKCWADEAHLGGIVIQIYGKQTG